MEVWEAGMTQEVHYNSSATHSQKMVVAICLMKLLYALLYCCPTAGGI